MKKFEGKNILVIGIGKSGFSAAKYLSDEGASVCVMDSKRKEELKEKLDALNGYNVEFVSGGLEGKLPPNTDMVVVSPGVPLETSVIQDAVDKRVPVIGDLELALPNIKRPIVAVTGTNGKTTTTSLIAHLLRESGYNVCVAGNIGTPLLDELTVANHSEYVVLEISSFQIETTPSLKPYVGILLNITPDHLDRHQIFESYAKCKARLIAGVPDDGFGIYNATDISVLEAIGDAGCTLIPFDPIGAKICDQSTSSVCSWYENGALHVKVRGEKANHYDLEGVSLEGVHNRENMLAALAAAEICGANSKQLGEALRTFKGLPHRIELVAEKNGIRFFDDSKGTNIGATIRAIELFNSPVVLIAGGISKGVDFEPLKSVVKGRVKKAVLIGEATNALEDVLSGATETQKATSMQDAVEKAFSAAKSGDVVLLSPACSSFDMFRDYVHRGEEFAKAVMKVTREI